MSNKGNSSPSQVSSELESENDQNRIGLDWLPEPKDGRIIFEVRLKRAARQNAFSIGINPAQLGESEYNDLRTIITGVQNKLSSAREIYFHVGWLLDVALRQEGLAKEEERVARINALLLRDRISPKERYFGQQGKQFLTQSGTSDFIRSTRKFPGYNEVCRSWQKAIAKYNVGTPRLKTENVAEEEELELFFIELRHDDSFMDAGSKHKALVDKWNLDQDFLDAVAGTIKKRLIPDPTPCRLEFYLLCFWIDGGFWLISHEDRALILRKCYRPTNVGLSNVTGEMVRKAVKKLGFKDWHDFMPKGFWHAPYKVDFANDHQQQETYRFVPQEQRPKKQRPK